MDDFERLYQTTYTAVVRFLYRKVWDADRAEDLAQEVFMRLFQHRPDKPRAWVFAVAANLARDEARAAIRRRKHLTLLINDPSPGPSRIQAADELVEHDEQMAAVQQALNELTPALEKLVPDAGHHLRRDDPGTGSERTGSGGGAGAGEGIGVVRQMTSWIAVEGLNG